MSWLFSRALVAEYSADTCSDGEQCAQWNVMPTPQGFWHRDKMMDPSRLSQFGQTSRLLTGAHGEAVLTSYLEAFPARTSVSPAQEAASKETAQDFGRKWPGSFARFDLETCSWRTRQHSLLGGLELYSGSWPQWGLMLGGESWERATLAPRTKETVSGLWPTLTASIGTKCGGRHRGKADTLSSFLADVEGLETSSTSLVNPVWGEWFMGFPTGWSDLKPLGTHKYREWLRWHGGFSVEEPEHAGDSSRARDAVVYAGTRGAGV